MFGDKMCYLKEIAKINSFLFALIQITKGMAKGKKNKHTETPALALN